ncbi:NlpC/P60 family protein [Pseudotabrizicola algicola]|uniref:Peptidase n=1 Tax=Pseudotabrizicola algicola TaxID=2709381 RepID=A0A6B3RI51_9RHOB|nr:NlpC/P60 family protein [Pseudotabrizicola algicola]NEX44763.1 peptidase [Pseudotabrizicola algicola]
MIVAEARKWIGTPYRHQFSACDAGTDCLGLIRGVWRAVIGPEPVRPPPYSEDWAEPSGDEVLMQAACRYLLPKQGRGLAKGNVLLFRMKEGAIAKHLGILSDDGPRTRFIHAYTGHGVVETSLSGPWLRRVAAVYSFPHKAE